MRPIPQTELDYLNSLGFTVYLDGVVATAGDTAPNYKEFKVVLENGGVILDGYGVGRDADGYQIANPTIAPDRKSATISYWYEYDLTTQIQWEIEQSISIKNGVNDTYIIDIGSARSIIEENWNRGQNGNIEDFGKYLLGLIELPFSIPDDLIDKEQNINLGELETDYVGTLLKDDTLIVNLGSIYTPVEKNNFLDYKNKTAIIHLPYCEPVAIEIEYVINETISIEYQINLYSGMAIINISSSKIDGVILQRNVDLNVTIPFGSVTSNPSRNDPKNVELGGDNGVKNPYIEVLTNKAILEDGFFTIPITDETEISNCNGFIKVDEINLVSKAPTNEKQMILNQLSNGVII